MQTLMINSGLSDSLIMTVSRLQCLESTEGGESDTELADCNFMKTNSVFIFNFVRSFRAVI